MARKYPILKNIRINESELANWDSNKIHDLLQGKIHENGNTTRLVKEMYRIMNDSMIFKNKPSDKDIAIIKEVKEL